MTPKKKPRRAVGVVRVSQVNGRDEDDRFVSPAVQRERMDDLCRRENLQLTRPPYEEFDVSGGKPLDRRTGLTAAIRDVEEGRADVIVVAYFDRLVRSLEVQAEVLRRVERAGAQVLTADLGRVSTETAGQWLNATLHGMVSEYYNRLTAEKAGAAQVRAVARGDAPHRLPPGLRREDKRIVLDSDLSPIVAEAVRMRADGATIATVRDYLRANGISRSYHGTASLLKSRLLIGEVVFGANRARPEDVLRGECPAVVDRETWERAQRVSVPRGRKAKSDRLLARLGVLRCGTCGARMVTATANHNRYHVYRCPPTGDCLQRVSIAAEIVEAIVERAVREGVDGQVAVQSARDGIQSAQIALQRAQDDLEAAIRTLSDFANEPAAVERLAELRRVRDSARDRLDRLGPAPEEAFVLLAHDWGRLAWEDKRRCIRAVIDRAIVAPAERRGQPPDERVEIRYHAVIDHLESRVPRAPRVVRLRPAAESDATLREMYGEHGG